MPSDDDILHVLVDVTGEPAVRTSRDAALFDGLGLDSLGAVELLAALNARFGLHIALSEINRDAWATPNRVIAFVRARA